jgi:RNA-directed DNA polymerase
VLNAIYEEDFLGFSCGFRPKRNPHDALDALTFAIYSKKVNYISMWTSDAFSILSVSNGWFDSWSIGLPIDA